MSATDNMRSTESYDSLLGFAASASIDIPMLRPHGRSNEQSWKFQCDPIDSIEPSGMARKDGTTRSLAPDLYEEDECDIGPRMMDSTDLDIVDRLPSPALQEILIIFRRAALYQSGGDFANAKKLYDIVICTLRQTTPLLQAPPVKDVLDLFIRTHNNYGVISYMEDNEKLASYHFWTAVQCADQLAPFAKSYTLMFATALSNFCRLCWMLGGINEKLYLGIKKVLELRLSVLAWDHPDVVASRYNLAVAEYARHNSEAAKAQLLQYLAAWKHRTMEKRLDDLDPFPAVIYLLLIQNEKNDDIMSMELFRALRTLQDKRHELGPQNIEVAAVLNYTGTLLFHMRDLESALVIFQEELCIENNCKKRVSNESAQYMGVPSIRVTCNNIGRVLQEMGRFQEAITYYARVIEPEKEDSSESLMKRMMLQADCKDPKINVDNDASPFLNLFSTVWYNLGLIHDNLRAYDEAILAFKKSLEFRKILHGSDHPDIACLLYNIGVLQMEQQHLHDASVSIREALRIHRSGATGQLADSYIVKTLKKLSSLHKAKGNFHSALAALQDVLVIEESLDDLDAVTRMKESGVTLRNIAELCHATGDIMAAIQMAKESVHKFRRLADLVIELQMQQSYAQKNVEQAQSLERGSDTEQLVSSLLLLGSYFHEMCEPLQAKSALEEGMVVIQHTLKTMHENAILHVPSSLLALQEVVSMVAACQCAPEA